MKKDNSIRKKRENTIQIGRRYIKLCLIRPDKR